VLAHGCHENQKETVHLLSTKNNKFGYKVDGSYNCVMS